MGQFALEQVHNCSGATTELSRYGMLFFGVPVARSGTGANISLARGAWAPTHSLIICSEAANATRYFTSVPLSQHSDDSHPLLV